MILVTAANGNQDQHLVPKLVGDNYPIRAIVKSQASAEQLKRFGC
jgi:uncharacterized protein YbjT (DUF2867 family)